MMSSIWYKKGLIFGIVLLLGGVSIISIVSGDINKILKNEITYRDEILDIVVSNPMGGTFSVLLGDGSGGFGYVYSYFLGLQTSGIVEGDFDLDGFLDIAITKLWFDSISVLKGDGNGYFDECMNYTVGTDPFFITTGDFNLDGFLDLVISNSGDNDISILLNDGNGYFGENRREDFPTGECPTDLIAGDFNNDDLLDVVTVNSLDDNISILIGDGDGGFLPHVTYSTGELPVHIAAGDFNNDYALDLVITNHYDSDFSILFNNGSAGFNNRQDFFVGLYPIAILSEDFNDDNALDIALTYGHPGEIEYVDIFLGDNTGDFQLYSAYNIGDIGWDIITADFNGDDSFDLAISVPDRDSICVLFGDNTGYFSDYEDYYAGYCPFYMVYGDFNSNNPPDPPVITGTTNGKTGTSYTYTFTSVDPDNDDIAEYIVNWGDNTGEETITGPFPSGSPATASHKWNFQGTYTIKAKAVDIYGAGSDWAEFEVTIPRNKIVSRYIFKLSNGIS
jgi:hypothetical protein